MRNTWLVVVGLMMSTSVMATGLGNRVCTGVSCNDREANLTSNSASVGLGVAGARSGDVTGTQTVSGGNSTNTVTGAPQTTTVGDQVSTLTGGTQTYNGGDNVNTMTGTNTNTMGDVTGTQTNTVGDTMSSVGDYTVGDVNGGSQSASVGDQVTSVDGNNSTNTNTASNVIENGAVQVQVGGPNGEPLTASSQAVDASAQVQEGAVQISENNSTTFEAPDIPVPTAAPSFASVCTSGVAAQRTTYGISIAVTSNVCEMLMMADAYMAVGETEKALKYVNRAGKHSRVKGVLGHIRHVLTIGIL